MTSTDRKARAVIYREAAQRVLEMQHACCCWSIGKDHPKESGEFYATFDSGDYAQYQDWTWGQLDDGNALVRLQRSLALCFMAAMVEAGDA